MPTAYEYTMAFVSSILYGMLPAFSEWKALIQYRCCGQLDSKLKYSHGFVHISNTLSARVFLSDHPSTHR